MCYYVLNIALQTNSSVKIDGNNNLNALDVISETRVRQRKPDTSLDIAEKEVYVFVNSLAGWLCIKTSQFFPTFLNLY